MVNLVKRNLTIAEEMRKKFPEWINGKKPKAGKEFNDFRDGVAKIFAKLNYSPQEEMDNATMNDLFEMKPGTENYIKWVGCARSWANSVECAMLSQIDSVQDRRCTTILHKGAMLYDKTNSPHLFNASAVSESRYSYFNAKEVVKMLVDFQPDDYADLKRQIGSRIIFHDNKYVASSMDPDFFVTRGFRYDFNIDREDLVLPETSKERPNCVKYEENNIDQFKSKINPREPLYFETCFQNCIVRNIIHRSNCWPTTMPYYRNDTYDPGLDLKSCTWFREPPYFAIYRELLRVERLREQEANELRRQTDINVSETSTPSSTTSIKPPTSPETNDSSTTKTEDAIISLFGTNSSAKNQEEMKAYMKIRRECWSKCSFSCTLTRYSVTVTRQSWPSDVGMLFDQSGRDKRLRHCCALITIKYSHFHYSVNEFMAKYNLADTLGNVGGLLAVWLNLSMVSVYHAVQKLVDFLNNQSIAKTSRVQPQ